jgi:hypothetical protein
MVSVFCQKILHLMYYHLSIDLWFDSSVVVCYVICVAGVWHFDQKLLEEEA